MTKHLYRQSTVPLDWIFFFFLKRNSYAFLDLSITNRVDKKGLFSKRTYSFTWTLKLSCSSRCIWHQLWWDAEPNKKTHYLNQYGNYCLLVWVYYSFTYVNVPALMLVLIHESKYTNVYLEQKALAITGDKRSEQLYSLILPLSWQLDTSSGQVFLRSVWIWQFLLPLLLYSLGPVYERKMFRIHQWYQLMEPIQDMQNT